MISLCGRKISGIRYGSTSVKEVRVGNRLAWSPEANFVAVGSGGHVKFSPDGIAWYSGSAGSSDLNSVCYGNGRFVAVGKNGAYATSADGKTWTVGSKGSMVWNRICYGNGTFVAVGCTEDSEEILSGGMGVVMYSTDGFSWTVKNTSTGGNFRTWHDVCFGGGKFVAVGMRHVAQTSRADMYARVAYSTNLTTWMEKDVSMKDVQLENLHEFDCIAHDGTKFVAICGGHDVDYSVDLRVVASSTDGITWTKLAVTKSYDIEKRMCFGNLSNGIYLGVFGDNNYSTSEDAVIWNRNNVANVPVPRTSCVDGICFGGSKIIAVGSIFAVSTGEQISLRYVCDARGVVFKDVCFKEVEA